MNRFDPLGLLRALHQHQVAFVVIGGVASLAHGSPSLTRDLDICYEQSRNNLEALARMLQEVHAKPRGLNPELPFRLDAATLRLGDHFIFSTDLGDLDCLGTPAGTNGYRDLLRNAVDVPFQDMVIKIVGLEDLMRMKRAAGRPKDLAELEILGALRDELERQAE